MSSVVGRSVSFSPAVHLDRLGHDEKPVSSPSLFASSPRSKNAMDRNFNISYAKTDNKGFWLVHYGDGNPPSHPLFPVDHTRNGDHQTPCQVIPTIIPSYNEDFVELSHTIRDIYKMQQHPAMLGRVFHCFIIFDGWKRISNTMRNWLLGQFASYREENYKPMRAADMNERPWPEILESTPQERHATVIMRPAQAVAPSFFQLSTKGIPSTARLLITVCIKADNRRKHNSHRWFLDKNGFMGTYPNAEYVFLTDLGTIFADDCVPLLVEYMDTHPNAAVATGRQRVMTRGQQETTENLISVTSLSRMAVLFDYEASFAAFNGAFALFGFLPVIPGPCGLYRTRTLLHGPLDWYFQTLESNASELGMLMGNLRIAEDRILSYAPLLMNNTEEDEERASLTVQQRAEREKHKDQKLYLALVPSAVFYFQQEETFTAFVSQRRRWNNGTVAGYVWLLSNAGIVWRSRSMSWYTKIAMLFLSALQLSVYAVVSISPSIFLMAIYRGLVYAVDHFAMTDRQETDTKFLVNTAWLSVVLLYAMFIVRHAGGYTRVDRWSFLILGILGALAIVGGITGIVRYLYDHVALQVSAASIMAILLIANFSFPFFTAILYSPTSFGLMVMSAIPFFLFLPTLVSWFGAYSFSRFWDISWGNRASDQMQEIEEARRRELQEDFCQRSYCITALIAIFNVSFALVTTVTSVRPWFVTGVLGALFLASLMQMILSCFFAIITLPERIFRRLDCFRHERRAKRNAKKKLHS